jgi:hypothetical protein
MIFAPNFAALSDIKAGNESFRPSLLKNTSQQRGKDGNNGLWTQDAPSRNVGARRRCCGGRQIMFFLAFARYCGERPSGLIFGDACRSEYSQVLLLATRTIRRYRSWSKDVSSTRYSKRQFAVPRSTEPTIKPMRTELGMWLESLSALQSRRQNDGPFWARGVVGGRGARVTTKMMAIPLTPVLE